MSRPAISILLPVRNEANYLPAAITSLQRQTLSDWELVVINDGSTDQSGSLLDELARRDRRIKVWHLPPSGLVAALNLGLQQSAGTYVARMDGDDVAHPDRLMRQKCELDNHPELDLTACRVRHFPRRQLTDGMRYYENWQNQHLSHVAISRDLFVGSPFAHPSVMYRRQTVTGLGGYREQAWAEDYDLWLRMALAGCRFSRRPETLLYWRDRPQRLTRTADNCTPEAFRTCKVHYLKQEFLAGRTEVTLWGAGKEGKAWHKSLAASEIRVNRWLEIDPRKLGQTIHRAPVVSPEAFVPGTDKILVTVGSKGARQSIRARCRQLNLVDGKDFVCVT